MNMNIPMQPVPVSYRLVKETSSEAFEKAVNKLLSEGYTFHGPTHIDASAYTQPMVQLEVRPIKMGKMDDSGILPVGGILQR